MITQDQWDALSDADQFKYARLVHERLVEVIKIAIDEMVGKEGEGFPSFSYLTALAEVAALGVSKDEPVRSDQIRMFIKYFKDTVNDKNA